MAKLGAPKKQPERRLSRHIGIRVMPHEHELYKRLDIPKEYLRHKLVKAIYDWAASDARRKNTRRV